MLLLSRTTLILSSLAACIVLTSLPSRALAADVGEIVFDSKTESMSKAGLGPVSFPHKIHENHNKCDECHPSIFKKKKGANNISMQKNMNGDFCGACHDSINSFPLYQCAKCHIKLKK